MRTAQGGVFTGWWHNRITVTCVQGAVPSPQPLLPHTSGEINTHQGSCAFWVRLVKHSACSLGPAQSAPSRLPACSPLWHPLPLTPPPRPPPALTAKAAPWPGGGCCRPGLCAGHAAGVAAAAQTAGRCGRPEASAGPRPCLAGALLPGASGERRGDSLPPVPTEPQGNPASHFMGGGEELRLREAAGR